MNQVLHLGCCISPCCGPLSLGVRFETYKQFVSLIFHFFARGKPRILNQRIRRNDCMLVLTWNDCMLVLTWNDCMLVLTWNDCMLVLTWNDYVSTDME
jgi:hypothetical protein